jgi:hypothetical protein
MVTKDSSFSEEKEAKRLFSNGGSRSQPIAWHQPRSAHKSLFCFFFLQKKEDSSFLRRSQA